LNIPKGTTKRRKSTIQWPTGKTSLNIPKGATMKRKSTIQWPTEKVQKDKQWFSKHYTENWGSGAPLKTYSVLYRSGMVCLSYLLYYLFSLIYKLWMGTSLLLSYGSWIYNYMFNQCLSPLKLWVRIPHMAGCSRCNFMWWSLSVACDKSVGISGYFCFLHQ